MDVNQLLDTVEKKSLQPKKTPFPKKSSDNSFDNVMNSISQNWETKDSEELAKLKKELKEAREQLKTIKEVGIPLTKNENKILAAIRSEELIQETKSPQISYNRFRKEYKVSSNYYRKSVDSLLAKGMITQEETSYSGEITTFRWTIKP